MKIVVNGCGKIGSTIVRALTIEGHDVVTVDMDPARINEITGTYDVMGIVGNGGSPDILKECGAGDCDVFISVVSSDEINMLACFFARKMGAKHTVARIRDTEFSDDEKDFFRRELGLSLIINPDLRTAREIHDLLRFPSAVKVERFSNGMDMAELVLREGSMLSGLSLVRIREKFGAHILVCCVLRGGQVIIPDGSFVLETGDRIGITGSVNELGKFMRSASANHKKARDIMILGGSRTATYLAGLIINGGNTVRIVERDRQKCESLCEKLPKAIVINADGTDHDALLEEGLGTVDAFVSLTGLDEQNILTAVHASSVAVSKSVAKVNSGTLAKMAEKIGLDTAVSPKNAVSDVVVRYVRALNESVGSDFETLYRVFDGQVEAIEFRAKSDCKILKTQLKSLKTQKNILVAGIIRDGKVIIPGGSDSVLAGDRVIIIAAGQRIDTLDGILA